MVLRWAIFGMALLAVVAETSNEQTTEPVARQLAESVVRSELRSKLDFKSGQFLAVKRDEELEHSLAIATVGWRTGPVFIYRASPAGVEIRRDSIVNHIATDADFVFIVAVNSADGTTYRLHDFGLATSLGEFERLIAALRVHVASADQAESIAEFYREVNPENYGTLSPTLSLVELKQAAERQCQNGAKSFDAGEKAFTDWWRRAGRLYAALPFEQKAVPHDSGYSVEWIVLSSPSGESCGGAPLRAQLEVSSDGRVGKVTFVPISKGLRKR